MAVCNPALVAVFGADRADGTGEESLIRLMRYCRSSSGWWLTAE